MNFFRFVFVFCVMTLQVLAAAPPAPRYSASRDLGLGIVLGEPTGFSGKYWLDDQKAIDGIVGYRWGKSVVLAGDFLWHFAQPFGADNDFTSRLFAYVGGGLMFGAFNSSSAGNTNTNATEFGLALRIPAGLEWRSFDQQFGVYLEVAPGMAIAPSTAAVFNGGVGGRYYFAP